MLPPSSADKRPPRPTAARICLFGARFSRASVRVMTLRFSKESRIWWTTSELCRQSSGLGLPAFGVVSGSRAEAGNLLPSETGHRRASGTYRAWKRCNPPTCNGLLALGLPASDFSTLVPTGFETYNPNKNSASARSSGNARSVAACFPAMLCSATN